MKKCNFRLKSPFMSETTPCKAVVSIVSEFIIGCQPVVHTESDIVLLVLCVCLSVRPSNAGTYNDQILLRRAGANGVTPLPLFRNHYRED